MEARMKSRPNPDVIDGDPAPQQGDPRRRRRPAAAGVGPPAGQSDQRLLARASTPGSRRRRSAARPTSGCTTWSLAGDAVLHRPGAGRARADRGRHPDPGRRAGCDGRDLGRGRRPLRRAAAVRDHPGDRAHQLLQPDQPDDPGTGRQDLVSWPGLGSVTECYRDGGPLVPAAGSVGKLSRRIV